MTSSPLTLHWPAADDTARTGRALGPVLTAGDVILLTGDVGAGKTHFARALIQSILDVPEDVPSPTFTLVQVYDTARGAVWHADLYRITSDIEVDELGLVDAFDDAICLVEWPDRLGPIAPETALSIAIATEGTGRAATLTWTDPRWARRLAQVTTDA
ncbi:tRNA (adenosine(37)-N6)-threonylcarbamoyltransferase complex ATPase subunit type 1 TsaE [uncultured Tateyamaria sp.]|uniref:tRNA (adenosine(37)-N6)-threonylcarbamoyltransferase complex ATPase subunit type 1 TsaE n=1 Tax=uncultured Tateyamaria sp. TaxID=455651 RepID=UPI00260D3256|nr:tRNA (adenosine(37)-N6)-threonylcarbamoyltransferase complex ATPase subunit type 1 TsaE [uncultured Tateyamaria sp.]